jgi:hypothetical protein
MIESAGASAPAYHFFGGAEMKYSVYYSKPDFDFMLNDNLTVEEIESRKTHVQVTVIDGDSLENVFFKMQGEVWSPRGEARGLIEALGLRHTSMMVGDVIKDPEGVYYQVDHFGFREIGKSEVNESERYMRTIQQNFG